MSRRWRSCEAVASGATGDPEDVLGGIDALKLRSSMTLFARADPQEPVFTHVLEHWYGGRPDEATERILGPVG
jgi:uncharacterized protein (DUF1810 family)